MFRARVIQLTVPLEVGPCSKICQPLQHGGKSTYSNFCLANAAGWELANFVSPPTMRGSTTGSGGGGDGGAFGC